MNKIILLFVLMFCCVVVYAQSDEIMLGTSNESLELEALSFDKVFEKITTEEAQPTMNIGDATSSIKFVRIENEFYYVLILAAMCMVSLSVVLYFLQKLKKDPQPKDIISSAGLIIIVFSTIILVLIVDTSEQLTAAIGILGAIAGYLFRSAQEEIQHIEPSKLPEEK